MCRAAAGVFARLLRPVCFLYYITFCPGLQGLTPGFLSVHEDFSFLLGLLRGGTCAPARPFGRRASLPCRASLPWCISAAPCCAPPFLPHLPISRRACNFPSRFPSLLRLQTPRPLLFAPLSAPALSAAPSLRCCYIATALVFIKSFGRGWFHGKQSSHNLFRRVFAKPGPGQTSV